MPHRSALVLIVTLALLPPTTLPAQQTASAAQSAPGAIAKADREKALGILDGVSKGIRELYYDPKMNGLDWNAVLANARVRLQRPIL